jgi:hypothetical protein
MSEQIVKGTTLAAAQGRHQLESENSETELERRALRQLHWIVRVSPLENQDEPGHERPKSERQVEQFSTKGLCHRQVVA